MKPDIIARAEDIVSKCEEGYVSTINESGFPETATRSNIKPEGIRSAYFVTGTSGSMAKSVQKNRRSSVCFCRDSDNVSLTGEAFLITDPKIKKELWQDWFLSHFPGGIEDPEYCVIRFESEKASLWIDREQVHISLESVMKPQSYCGLLCDFCEFKSSHNCRGCLTSRGNPFYGECPIAACCQDKNLEHCGHCNEMPCEKLHAYSCGEGEHCDNPKGSRLRILKHWKERGVSQ